MTRVGLTDTLEESPTALMMVGVQMDTVEGCTPDLVRLTCVSHSHCLSRLLLLVHPPVVSQGATLSTLSYQGRLKGTCRIAFALNLQQYVNSCSPFLSSPSR